MNLAFTTLILTAGKSQRMGFPKAFLLYKGVNILEKILKTSFLAGSSHIIVVVGSHQKSNLVSVEDVKISLKKVQIKDVMVDIVVGNPKGHPIDSIRLGLKKISYDNPLLLWSIDYPFADSELILLMRKTLSDNKNKIVIPKIKNKRSHPIFLGYDVIEELNSKKADLGAHYIVRDNPKRVLEFMSDDIRLSYEINTPKEAHKVLLEIPKIK